MTLTEVLAEMSTGAFLATMTPAEILAFSLQMLGLIILLPALAILMGSILWWQIKVLKDLEFTLSSILRSPIPMEHAKAQMARVRTGRTARILKWSGCVGPGCIIAGSFVLALFTDGEY